MEGRLRDYLMDLLAMMCEMGFFIRTGERYQMVIGFAYGNSQTSGAEVRPDRR